jgi:hypothetical protein
MKQNKKKKGQIAGQIFIYILAVMVIGGMALVGYSAIKGLTDKACSAEKATFNNNLNSKIEKDMSFGSVTPENLNAPCDYDQICFVETSVVETTQNPSFSCPNQIIYDSVLTNGIEQNIFVISDKSTIPIGYSDIISFNSTDTGKCLCIEQRNHKFFMTFKGQGSTTQITKG